MPRAISNTSLSVVPPAARKSASPGPTGSSDIRRAGEILRQLLMLDDSVSDGILVGTVAEGLNHITLELESLAGRQELFEMYCAR